MAHRTIRPRTTNCQSPVRLAAALALVAALALALVALLPRVAPEVARASELPATQSSPVTDAVPSELQQRVEQSAAAYNEAVAAREEVEAQVADCEARIAELEERLPAVQDQAAGALGTLYRLQQNSNGLLELLLSADDFNDFITTLAYLNSVTAACTDLLEELGALSDQLNQEQEALQTALAEAQAREDEAQAALAEAQAAREEAQRRAAEEAARAAALAAQQARAAAEAQDGSDDADAGTNGSSDDAGSAENGGESWDDADSTADDPGSWDDSWDEPADDGVDWSDERSVFVAQWGGRIDAYLAGSPLSGYGSVFAAAAWDYGVDPRWSPAIACIESSKGAYCFASHNAWGWGSVSWDSWEEAIYGHVGGLARGYGYTISYDAALRYCPSNADYWYSGVLGQMELI